MDRELELIYAESFVLQSKVKFVVIAIAAVVTTGACGYRIAIAKDNAEGLGWLGGITTVMTAFMRSPGSDLRDAMKKSTELEYPRPIQDEPALQ